MIAILIALLVLIALAALGYRGRTKVEGVSHAVWISWLWVMILLSRSPSAWFDTVVSGHKAIRYTEGNPLEAALFALLIMVALWVLNSRPGQVRYFLRANTPLLAYLAYCLITMLWSEDPAMTFKRYVKGIGAIAIVLVVLTEKNVIGALERMLVRAAYVLLTASAILIVFVPSIGTFYDSTTKVLYYIGITTQKNELGQCCLICGTALFWAFQNAWYDRQDRHRIHRLIWNGLMYVLALALIKMCDSMTAMSCLLFATGVLLVVRRKRPIRKLHGWLGGMVALAAFASFLDSSGTLLRLLGRNATLTGRTDIWRAVLLQHTNPLLGTGFESFWTNKRIESVWQIIGYTGIAEAHNGYLEIYLNVGLIGVTIFSVLLLDGYKNAVLSYRINPAIGQIKLALFVACVIHNFAESSFRPLSPIWMCLMIATVHYLPESSLSLGEGKPQIASFNNPGHRIRLIR